MTEWLGNHLWQSTLVTVAAGVLALAFRSNSAQVRYGIWLAASLKFLVPFSVLTGIGSRLTLPVSTASAPEPVVAAVAALAQPFTAGDIPFVPAASDRVATAASASADGPEVVALIAVALWAAGCAMVLLSFVRQWRRIAAIARTATPVVKGREVDILRRLAARAGLRRRVRLMRTDAALEPGVFGLVRPVLLWPGTVGTRLDESHVESILAHELCHLRRHDNLAAAAHTVVQALFWFHPLVWVLGGRLVAERERACDEEVLRLGHEPAAYAASILRMCEFCLEAPACVAGVTGADLKRRIETIMHNRIGERLTLGRKLAIGAVAALLVAAPIGAGALGPQAAATQGQIEIRPPAPPAGTAAAEPSPDLRFEVASVKPNKSGDNRVMIGMQPGGRFTSTNGPLVGLIRMAYQIQPFQLIDAPSWTESERFDISARAEMDIRPTPPGTVGPMQIMVRNLLADRFNLKVRHETRDMPIYALVLARTDGQLGPQLKVSSVDCEALFAAARAAGGAPPRSSPGERPQCGMRMGPGQMSAGATRIAALVSSLSPMVQRVVVDKTGLKDTYDMDLKWTPDRMPQGAPPPGAPPLPPIDPDGPSIFTALQEQLGLKLEAQRGPVNVVVVEHVERPTPD